MPIPPNELSLVPIAPTAAPDASTTASSATAGLHARPLGPGWFDSSFELQRGLVIQEGWNDDAGLRAWVETFLGGQRTAGGGESSSAT